MCEEELKIRRTEVDMLKLQAQYFEIRDHHQDEVDEIENVKEKLREKKKLIEELTKEIKMMLEKQKELEEVICQEQQIRRNMEAENKELHNYIGELEEKLQQYEIAEQKRKARKELADIEKQLKDIEQARTTIQSSVRACLHNQCDSSLISNSISELEKHTDTVSQLSVLASHDTALCEFLQSVLSKLIDDVEWLKDTVFICPICSLLEETAQLECKHKMCSTCITQLLKNSVATKQFPAKCPSKHCNAPISYNFALHFLPDSDVHIYALGEIEKSYTQMYCPKCSTPLSNDVFYEVEKVMCPSCNIEFCQKCKIYWEKHKDKTCEQVKDEENELNAQYISNNTQKCPNCKVPVEKLSGCNHMVCASTGTIAGCGAHFCYLCGKEVDPNNLVAHFGPDHPLLDLDEIRRALNE